MQKYACTNCSCVYNPFIGEESVESRIFFDDLDESWVCPHCGEGKEYFTEIPENIQDFSPIGMMTEQEASHTSFYKEQGDQIIIRIGADSLPHANEKDHFIEYIGLFETDGEIIDIKIQPTEDIVIFENPDRDDYEVRLSCNLHGVWRGVKI